MRFKTYLSTSFMCVFTLVPVTHLHEIIVSPLQLNCALHVLCVELSSHGLDPGIGILDLGLQAGHLLLGLKEQVKGAQFILLEHL